MFDDDNINKELNKLAPHNITKEEAFEFITNFNFQFLPYQLKEDFDLAHFAIEKNAENYQYVSNSLKKNKDLIIKALSANPLLVKFVPEKLLIEQYIIELTLFLPYYSPTYDWSKLKDSMGLIKNVTMMAVAPIHSPVHTMSGNSSGILPIIPLEKRPPLDDDILKFFPSSVTNNRDIILKTVSIYGARLKNAPIKFKHDKEIVLAAVTNDSSYLEYASHEIKAEVGDDPVQYLTAALLHENLDKAVPSKKVNTLKKKI